MSDAPQRPRILVADDHSDLVEVICARLEHAGYEVVTAHDGAEVIAQTARAIPDLYILDVTMPKLNGYEVCKWLKHNAVTATVPVILCTGSEPERLRVMGRAVELGAVHWLLKPFQSQDLLELVRSALVRKTTTR